MCQGSQDDSGIVADLRSGDILRMKSAVEAMNARYRRRVTTWVFHRCPWLLPGELADVWEAAVSVLVRRAVKGKVVSDHRPLWLLLKKIAHRRAIDLGRRRHRAAFRQVSLEQLPESFTPQAPAISMEIRGLVFDILDVIDTFPKTCRDVWLAFADCGFAARQEELIELASIRAGRPLTPRALKHHLARGRKKLALWLEILYPELVACIRKRARSFDPWEERDANQE